MVRCITGDAKPTERGPPRQRSGFSALVVLSAVGVELAKVGLRFFRHLVQHALRVLVGHIFGEAAALLDPVAHFRNEVVGRHGRKNGGQPTEVPRFAQYGKAHRRRAGVGLHASTGKVGNMQAPITPYSLIRHHFCALVTSDRAPGFIPLTANLFFSSIGAILLALGRRGRLHASAA